MTVLIDTNVFLALVFPRDANHQQARSFIRELRGTRIVAAPVLPELFYLTTKHVGYAAAISVFDLMRSPAFQIEPLTPQDMARMREIMTQYQDAEFDFVDVSIMALAERLNVTQVCTFDRRDFSAFRPRHCDYLELLP